MVSNRQNRDERRTKKMGKIYVFKKYVELNVAEMGT